MKLERAIEIVLELARENILTEGDAKDNDIEDERNKQFDACGTLEDFAQRYHLDPRRTSSLKGE